MVAIDFNLEAIQENNRACGDFDDAEETLSFSDLPLNSNSTMEDRDDYSKEYETSSFLQDDNSFEFFSQDFALSITTAYPSTDIVFCGKKLIPTQKQEITKSRNSKFKSRILPWKSNSFKIPKQEKSFIKTCKSFPVNNSQDHHQYSKNEYDFPRKRATISPNSVKSRRYLFGLRIPMKMELKDMKTRQSKRKPSTMFRYENTSEMVKNDKAKRLKGLWRLLRLFVFG